MKNEAWNWISENEKMIIEASEKVWNLAELGLVEHKSAEYLAKILEEQGFVIESGVADIPTAFVATYG
ncbi:MAG: amidohydrolase, partial [Candidatus Thorarchaeota archaeon]